MKIEVTKNKLYCSEHNDIMRLFDQPHANISIINGPRPDESSFLQHTSALSANRLRMEAGGSSLLVNALDWISKLRIPKIASYTLLRN